MKTKKLIFQRWTLFLFLGITLISGTNSWAQKREGPIVWPPPYCSDDTPCNIINHGSPLDDPGIYLSSISTNVIDNVCTQDLTTPYIVDCWFPICGIPGVPVNQPVWGGTCGAYPGTGTALPSEMQNQFSLGAANNGDVAMMGQRCNFINGHTYNIYFKIKTTGLVDNFYVKLGNIASVSFGWVTPSYAGWLEPEPSMGTNQTIYSNTNINNSSFTYYCASFTANANYDMLYLYPKMNVGTPANAEVLYISDIHVNDLTVAAFSQTNYELDCNQSTATFGNTDCTLPSGGTWNWTISPSAPISGTTTATPTVGPILNYTPYPLNYTVTATYTLPGTVGGCSASVSHPMVVQPLSTISILGSVNYCTEPQLNFSTSLGTCSGCSYIWWISSGGSTVDPSTDESPTATVITDGMPFTLYVEVTTENGCTYQAQIQVNSNCCQTGKDLVLINTTGPGDTNDDILMSTNSSAIAAATNIYIQGELIIDVSSTLHGKNITFAQNSKITVQAGKTLNVGTSALPSHLHGCNYMWYGIDATAAGANVTFDYSVMEDALNGIHIKSTANLASYSSVYRNNYIGIKYESHTSASDNQIRKCIFNSSAANDYVGPLTNPGYLLPPHFGKHGQAGILAIASNLNFSPTVSYTNRNTFAYLQNGIYVVSTHLTVSNAWFNQIKDYNTSNPLVDGKSIVAINFFNIGNYNLNVNNVKGPANFTLCNSGIWVSGTHTTKIENTTMTNVDFRGIYHENVNSVTSSDQLLVKGNSITNSADAIHFYTCGSTNSLTTSNTLNNASHITGSIGITVDEYSASTAACSTPRTKIENNVIKRFSLGIFTLKASCVLVTRNNVYMLNPATEQYHGISLHTSSNNRVTDNNVFGVYKDWRSIGTRFYNSQNNYIGCNNIDMTGHGMWLDGNCANSIITTNVFTNYAMAFYLVGSANIGDQYISGNINDVNNSLQKASYNVLGDDIEFATDGSAVNAKFHFMPGCSAPYYTDICNMDVKIGTTEYHFASSGCTFGNFKLLADADRNMPLQYECITGGAGIQGPSTETSTSDETNDETLGTEGLENESNVFTVYPNPANEQVSVSYTGEELIEFKLFDLQGRLLKTGQFNQITSIETIGFESGVYMLVLENSTNNSIEKFKIVVNH